MSPPESVVRAPLTIVTEDKAAEIFVLDGDLQMVARGIGAAHADLPEGIYKIKLRAGLDAQEDLLVHRLPRTDKKYPLLSFSSPAPLTATAEGSKDHAEATRRESRVVHVHSGAGSSIFVFARDWLQGDPTGADAANPAAGLRLEREGGELVAEIGTQAVRGDAAAGAWAACTVAVDPGLYRLSVSLPGGEVFAQSIAAAPSWQTQVFLLQRRDSRLFSGEPRANLGSAAIFMARSMGCDPEREDIRLTELARQALTNRRPVLSAEIREMLRLKFERPMLGIFAGHLLLQEERPDLALVRVVVQNLRALLSAPHPDVEALALAVELGTDVRFASPPMLRRSWTCIVQASAKLPDLVPAGSLASKIFLRLTNQEPWLVWRQDAPKQGEQQDLVETFLEVLKQLVERRDDLKVAASAVATSVVEQAKRDLEKGPTELVRKAFGLGKRQGQPSSRRPSALIPAPLMEALVSKLGIPRSSVESMIDEGKSRLSEALGRLKTLGEG